MNAIQILADQAWVERLGLTLLHFVWQGTIVVTMYAVVRKWGARTLGPSGRYFLACAVLTVMAVIPIVTWMLLPVQKSAAVTFSAPLSAPRTDSVPTIPFLLPSEVYAAPPGHFLSWVVVFWMIGATAFSLRLLSGWILAQRFRHRMVRAASLEWQRRLDRLKACISVTRPVRLLVSGLIDAPGSIGWLRPIVLVPAGALAGLPCAQMEALLLHELAHIRRHDYLVHILQSVVETVLFYHPGVWWVSGHMRTDRELCCDDMAVSITGDAVVYARALAEFDSARFIQPAVVAANGGSVAKRIARLLGQSSTSGHATSVTATVQALVLLAIGAWAVFAQTATPPQFEVASIKPSFSDMVMNVRPLPGRLTADATLQVLMQYAYGVAPFQVVGGPGWLTSERYQIDATANATASRDRMFLMLQSLLEDCFQLKIHRDVKEQPVFALVADKGGVKLPSPKEGVCVDSAADAATEWVGEGRMAAPGEVQPAKGRCGSAVLGLGPLGAQMHGGKIAMPELTRTLSMLLGRSVVDKTGFTGLFDLQLDFVPDDTTPAMPPPPPGSYTSGVSIAQALQQQLGLRLESARGPVQVIVVDQAERPSAN
jgi:uncharacterized protein (TIGR03435 family)